MSLPPTDSEPRQVVVSPPELPATPRELTPAVVRGSWGDPRVRFWLIVAAVFLVGMMYFGVTKLSDWASNRALVLSGEKATATVMSVGGATIQQRRPWDLPITVKFTAGTGQEVVSEPRQLSDKPDSGLVQVGDKLEIRYDKNNPSRWTDRKTPPGLAHSLIAGYLLGAMTLVTLAAALRNRGRYISTWRDGKLTPAAVLTTSNSPIAPTHTQVTAAPAGGQQVRIYVPRSLATPVRGDLIWILASPRGLPVAAQQFL